MKKRFKHIALWLLGWTFILLGIIGLFLPLMQGILFLLIGLSLLSTVSPWAERMLWKIRKRFPRIAKTFDQAKEKTKKWQDRLSARFDDAKEKVKDAKSDLTGHL